jgi:hypothetical protein
VEDKGILDTILISAKRLVGKVETTFSSLRIVRFSKISSLDSVENDRLAGLETAKKYREEKERFDLMQSATYGDFKNRHVWVKKATGLGITEFMLRFMAWLCLRNDDYRNSLMVIVTGPNQGIAIKLIKRTQR